MIRNIIFLVCIFWGATIPVAGASSIYDLESSWKTVDNKSTDLSIVKGVPVIIGMIYTGCAHACPMTIAKMKSIESALQKSGMKNTKYILASFDIKGDTPEKLKQYQKAQKLDPEKWIFLSPSSEDDARMLAVGLGISYRKIDNGDFSHSNVITMLDNEGKVVTKIDNLRADVDVFVNATKGK